MFGMGNSGRGWDWPRRRWMDEVMETTGLRLQQLKEAARDRVGWRDVVKIVTRGRLRPDGTRWSCDNNSGSNSLTRWWFSFEVSFKYFNFLPYDPWKEVYMRWVCELLWYYRELRRRQVEALQFYSIWWYGTSMWIVNKEVTGYQNAWNYRLRGQRVSWEVVGRTSVWRLTLKRFGLVKRMMLVIEISGGVWQLENVQRCFRAVMRVWFFMDCVFVRLNVNSWPWADEGGDALPGTVETEWQKAERYPGVAGPVPGVKETQGDKSYKLHVEGMRANGWTWGPGWCDDDSKRVP